VESQLQEELQEIHKDVSLATFLHSDEEIQLDWSRYKDGKLQHYKQILSGAFGGKRPVR
jgi:hypothetical protein